jgi:hypothetical protein
VHFRHSNERLSQPFDPGMIRASIILVVHFGRGGHPSSQAGAQLSHSPMKAVNGTVIRIAWHARFPAYRSILLTAEKFAALHAQDLLFKEHPILEARGAERGAAVRNVLVWSLDLVVAATAIVWLVFFRT